jgi:hypothetical protein
MNWYKKSQLNKEADGLLQALIGGIGITAIATMLGWTAPNVEKAIQENPKELLQQIQQVQEQEKIPIEKIEPTQNITIDKIWEIESSRGKDPNMDKNPSGARGHFQFLEATWDECVRRMGKDWDWWNGSMDYKKSSQVADFYLNTRIPELLNSRGIDDNINTRLAAYNWGIGNLSKAIDKYKNSWIQFAPSETSNYIIKYKG